MVRFDETKHKSPSKFASTATTLVDIEDPTLSLYLSLFHSRQSRCIAPSFWHFYHFTILLLDLNILCPLVEPLFLSFSLP